MALIHGLHFKNVRGDIYGGLVAAVVALPLALAFGVASGAGAIAGLYGAIFLGFFAALLGGTPAQVSGPTGPMTVVMAGILLHFKDDPALAFASVILGGAFMILFGLLGFGKYIALVPYPVISGFMSGIGAIILILQIGPLVGHEARPEGIVATLRAIPDYLGAPVFDATVAALLTITIVYLTPGFIAKWVPPPLLALLVLTPFAGTFLPAAPIIGEVPTGFPAPIVPMLQWDGLFFMLETAIVLALLGSIDSLLTSLVCDNMTRTLHDSNRELIGQGAGNMVAGFFGGLPGAGATMRSVANIRTGGRTPLSGALHALVLLGILLGLGPLAERIPLAVLGGILVKVGVDIIDWRFLRHLFQAPRADVMIMTIVFLITVLVDLITAVGVGVVLASLLFVKRMADLELSNLRVVMDSRQEAPLSHDERRLLERCNGRVVLIHVAGPMSFGSAKNMVRQLEAMPGLRKFMIVVLDLSDVPVIDGTAALAVEDVLRTAQAHKQQVFFVGLQPPVTEVLKGFGVLSLVPPGHLHATRLEALRHALASAGRASPVHGISMAEDASGS